MINNINYTYRIDYQTFYTIFDKITNRIVHSSAKDSCFSRYTNSHNSYNHNNNYVIYVYNDLNYLKWVYLSNCGFIDNKNFKIDFETINEWYLKELKKIGLNIKYDIVNRDNCLNSDVKNRNGSINEITRWTIDISKYSSRAKVKLALHMVRLLWEGSNFRILQKVYNFSQSNKRVNIVNMLNMFYNGTSSLKCGHGNPLHGAYFTLPITISELKKYYKLWENKPYNNIELSELNGKMCAYRSYGYNGNFEKIPSYSIKNLINLDWKYSEYVKQINKIMIDRDYVRKQENLGNR